jgi:hypothetical protein
MQNLTRNVAFLLIAAVVAMPLASAQGISAVGLADLSASADVAAKADASGAFHAVDDVRGEVEAAKGELENKAAYLRADAEARAEAALEQTEAQAQAGADASLSFGERAFAELQGAIEQVKEFAAGLFASAHVEADVDASGALQGAIEG